MQISEIKGEKAIDAIAELIEPITSIMSDEEVASHGRSENLIQALKVAFKKYPKDVLKVLAIFNGEDPDTYEPSLVQIPLQIMELAKDPDVKMLFTLQGQKMEEGSSGSATETTKETEKK